MSLSCHYRVTTSDWHESTTKEPELPHHTSDRLIIHLAFAIGPVAEARNARVHHTRVGDHLRQLPSNTDVYSCVPVGVLLCTCSVRAWARN